jgi:hypothetical protein
MPNTRLNDIELRAIFKRFADVAEVEVGPFLLGLTNLEGGSDDNVTQLKMTASNGDEVLAVVPHEHVGNMLVIKTISGESECDELSPFGRMKRVAGQWGVDSHGERQYGVFDGNSYTEIDLEKVSTRRQELRALLRDVMPG